MTDLRRKMFGWFGILILTLACAPGVATPVPTLDPNALNTAIVQTAAAASTKTAVAFQSLPVSPTFAPTLTQEPTYTAVPHIVFPTLTTEPRVQYFRIKHDSQLAMYNYQSRTAALDWNAAKYGYQTPEIARLTVAAENRSGTNRTDVSGLWGQFIDQLNFNHSRKIQYVKADNTALFNGTGYPSMESLTMGGNLITLNEIAGGWGRVRTMSYTDPEFEDIHYLTRPDLVHKFVLVGWRKPTRKTYLANPPPPYGDLYYPLVSSLPVWIPMELLEPFPFLPMQVTGVVDQPFYQEPSRESKPTGSEFSKDEIGNLVEYFPSGSEVWGKLSNTTGWILLFRYLNTGPTYFTTWEMETVPPFPPVEWPE